MTGTLFDDEVQGHDANHPRGSPSNESPENDRGEAGALGTVLQGTGGKASCANDAAAYFWAASSFSDC
jgi:hypothetical protein